MNTINQDDIDELQSFLEAVEPNRGEKDLFKQYQKALKTTLKLKKWIKNDLLKPQS